VSDELAEHTPRTHSVSGAVLAGGRSRRMGVDKRRLAVDGRPLLARAVDALRQAVGEVVVVAADGDAPALAEVIPDVPVVADLEPELGPLGGLVTALTHARSDVVVVVPGDHPALAPAVLQALTTALVADPPLQAVLLCTDRGPQPLVGAYRRGAAATVQELLDRGELRARALPDHLVTAVLDEATWRRLDPTGATATDLDTPEDVSSYAGRPGDETGPDHHRRSDAPIVQVRDGQPRETSDRLVSEEPLELLAAGPGQDPVPVLTTLRTPGHEVDLALGWLVSEGLLRPEDGPEVQVTLADAHLAARPEDRVTAWLPRPLDLRAAAERRTAATASCGVCGRASIEELVARCSPVPTTAPAGAPVPWSLVASLPDRLRAAQPLFSTTGGLHATGLFDAAGRTVTVREDVGRHNALDAAIGVHVRRGTLPLHDLIGVLSGRIGFELVAKAAVAGLPILAAVGAPSDLAVRTAERLGVTLVGFLRGTDGNIYTHPYRLDT
jgi:FdhD protein